MDSSFVSMFQLIIKRSTERFKKGKEFAHMHGKYGKAMSEQINKMEVQLFQEFKTS